MTASSVMQITLQDVVDRLANKFWIIPNWWFQIFFIFTSTWGNDPIWLYFSDGLKPPTRYNIWPTLHPPFFCSPTSSLPSGYLSTSNVCSLAVGLLVRLDCRSHLGGSNCSGSDEVIKEQQMVEGCYIAMYNMYFYICVYVWYMIIYVNIPGTCLSSILRFEASKTIGPFAFKRRIMCLVPG